MREQDQRTALLIGEAGIHKLREARVVVVGLGGVGGYAVEALVRAGIGKLTLVDFDTVQESNLNRQIIAEHDSIGLAKTDLFEQRAIRLNPQVRLNIHSLFADQSNFAEFLHEGMFLVDAIDSLEAKVGLLEYAFGKAIPCVSVFGAGNRLDPSKIRSGDLSESSGCPLGRRVRKALRERGVTTGIRVVYSIEEPLPSISNQDRQADSTTQKSPIGSISYMPGIMGLWAASEIIRIILDR